MPPPSPAQPSTPAPRPSSPGSAGDAALAWQRVVGFDPGLNITGYGVIDCREGIVRLVEAGTIRSRGETLETRLATIHEGVRDVLQALAPAVMAIEQVFVHAKFPRTAILMGHARGVICLAAAQAGLTVNNYPPTRVKSLLTGSGHAGKEQMQAAVQRELALAARPEPADVADALAVALADWHLRIRQRGLALGQGGKPAPRRPAAPRKGQRGAALSDGGWDGEGDAGSQEDDA
jgi:crossover junction endodeoxyribonuclease RuvC